MLTKLLYSFLKGLVWCVGLVLLLVVVAWTFGALWFDAPAPFARPAAWCYLFGSLAALLFLRFRKVAAVAVAGVSFLVMLWWFTLQPSNDRDWREDVSRAPWAEIKGDVVTLHDVRNFDYHPGGGQTPRWETRTVRLSQLAGADLAIDYWGVSWMAHPITIFRFTRESGSPPLAFSIETRPEKGEGFSALGGLYRQFELIYIAADERDVIRVRTNYRQGEDIYLYRTVYTPDKVRARFLEFIRDMNTLHERPRWYNALLMNCTTAIRWQRDPSTRMPFDWRILANGKMDQLFYETGFVDTEGLPFEELRRRAWINKAAQDADQDPAFSDRIREGRPGFGGQ